MSLTEWDYEVLGNRWQAAAIDAKIPCLEENGVKTDPFGRQHLAVFLVVFSYVDHSRATELID